MGDESARGSRMLYDGFCGAGIYGTISAALTTPVTPFMVFGCSAVAAGYVTVRDFCCRVSATDRW